jgi:hypothetical protein
MILVEMVCAECGKEKKESVSAGQPKPLICSECRNKKEQEEKRRYLEKLEGLPMEQRIRLIEEKLFSLEREGRKPSPWEIRY